MPGRKGLAVPIPAVEEHLLLVDTRRNGRQSGSEQFVGHGHPLRMPHQRPVDPGAADLGVGFDPQDADDLFVLDRQPEALLDRQRQRTQRAGDVVDGGVEVADVVFVACRSGWR